MQLNISGHHIEITDALRSHVSEKFDKLQRHIDHITNVEVTLIVEKLLHKAEAGLHVSGADLFASGVERQFYGVRARGLASHLR